MKSLLHLLVCLVMSHIVMSCASDGDAEGDLPLENLNPDAEGFSENDLGENDLGENDLQAGQENFENVNSDTNNEFANEGQGDNFANEGQGNNFADEAPSNFQDNEQLQFGDQEGFQDNLAQEGFQNNLGQEGFQNNLDQEGFQNNQLAMEGEALNNATEGDELFENNVQQAAVDTSTEGSQVVQMEGGLVKYVLSASSLYDKPDGNKIGNLEKGDHPLVFQDGEWSRTSDGYYIPDGDLTPRPVGRNRARSIWLN